MSFQTEGQVEFECNFKKNKSKFEKKKVCESFWMIY